MEEGGVRHSGSPSGDTTGTVMSPKGGQGKRKRTLAGGVSPKEAYIWGGLDPVIWADRGKEEEGDGGEDSEGETDRTGKRQGKWKSREKEKKEERGQNGKT